MKKVLTSDEQKNELCVNNETFMSFANRKFVLEKLLETRIHKTFIKVNVRRIEAKFHDNFKYVYIDFYLFEEFKRQSSLAHIKTKIHLMNDLKINVLIEMNIMKSEKITLDFRKKVMIISTCDNFRTLISIKKRERLINKAVRMISKITMFSDTVMTVSVHIRKTQILKNRDYSFFLKTDSLLESKEEIINSR